MTLGVKRLRDFAANVYVAFGGAVASIIGLVAYFYDKISPTGYSLLISILVGVIIVVFLAIGLYSVRVRQENRAFEHAAETLHKINHDYRDTLCKMFSGEKPVSDLKVLIDYERDALQGVCQAAARLFTAFTHTECMVTVKLITKEDDKKLFCGTYVRSQYNCERDQCQPKLFAINDGRNTAFDEALRFSQGKVSHFFSANLSEHARNNRYQNERGNWEQYYQSAIVVPIRYVNLEKVGGPNPSDDIGFLCVDTKSPNRLNDKFHLQYLAALADQMYNFMNLMRGRYRVPSVTGGTAL